MKLMMTPNPVGISHKGMLQESISEVISSWNANKPQSSWWGFVQGSLFQAVGYVLTATDHFVRAIDNMIPDGVDKKATVLEAISDVYDAIVPELLPIYLKPFNSRIKSFIIDILASMLIDFIVNKYRSGNWVVEE